MFFGVVLAKDLPRLDLVGVLNVLCPGRCVLLGIDEIYGDLIRQLLKDSRIGEPTNGSKNIKNYRHLRHLKAS